MAVLDQAEVSCLVEIIRQHLELRKMRHESNQKMTTRIQLMWQLVYSWHCDANRVI